MTKPAAKYILNWDEAFQFGVSQAGGKGWNLGRLARYGFKIPLVGVPVAAGKASGTARLISNPNEGSSLQPGDVLVAPSTDPGWTPLFLKACAVVLWKPEASYPTGPLWPGNMEFPP